MSIPSKNKKVVLYLPVATRGEVLAEEGPKTEQIPPLSLLAIAGPLLRKGYEVKIIDGRIEEDYTEKVLKECGNALCLGMSCMFGFQVYNGSVVSQRVKESLPDLPVVWGGWFPTISPELVIKENFADVAVRNQGEETFLEVLKAFEQGSSLDNILGITYRREGGIISTPDRPFIDINKLPPMPYHLVDMETYIRSDPYPRPRYLLSTAKGIQLPDCEVRVLWYQSSWGCPEDCTFCSSPLVSRRRWSGLDAEEVCDEIKGLVDQYKFNFIHFCDNLFFVDRDRVGDICEGILKRHLNIRWGATGHARLISRLDNNFLDLMERSGCYAVFMGIESAHRDTLNILHKRLKPEDVVKSVELLVNHNIAPILSYIVGIPGESAESVEETLEQCRYLKMRYSNRIEVQIQFYCPFPGASLHKEALKLGYEDPKTVLEWNQRTTSRPVFKYLKNSQIKKITRYRDVYFRWAFDILREKSKLNLAQKILHNSALIRIKYRMWVLPVEFWSYYLVRRSIQSIFKLLTRDKYNLKARNSIST